MGIVDDERRVRSALILRLTAGIELLLIALTWKLWFCASTFPRIPLFSIFLDFPDSAVVCVSAAFASLLLVCVVWPPEPSTRRACVLGIATLAAGTLTVCCNQHCLQPWHWMFLLVVSFRLLVPGESIIGVWRILAATIYIFAALSRLGPGIDEGMSRRVVTALLDIGGLAVGARHADIVSWLCITLTLGELLVGAMLLVRRLRTAGLIGGIAMHGGLLLALGPFGLQQATPVLVWNLFFAIWLLVLFGQGSTKDGDNEHVQSRSARLCAGFCFVWPALALLGVTDAWTGWQVYSPRPAIVGLQVKATLSAHNLDVPGRFIAPAAPLDDWQTIRLDRWCLEETGVPMYPAARFQLGICAWIAREVQWEREPEFRCRIDAPAAPLWWNRTTEDLPDVSAIREAPARYMFNGRANGDQSSAAMSPESSAFERHF